jgi:hypothetical protein
MSLLRLADDAWWFHIEEQATRVSPPVSFEDAPFFGGRGGAPISRLILSGPLAGYGYLETISGHWIAELSTRKGAFPARVVAAMWVPTLSAPLSCGMQLWVTHEDGELWRYGETGCVLGDCMLLPSTACKESLPEGIRAFAVQPVADSAWYQLAWVSTKNRVWTELVYFPASDRSFHSDFEPDARTEAFRGLDLVTTLPSVFAEAASVDLQWLADGKTLSVCSDTCDWCLLSFQVAAGRAHGQIATLRLHGTRYMQARPLVAAPVNPLGDRPGYVSSDGRFSMWLTKRPHRVVLMDSSTEADSCRPLTYRLPLPKAGWLVLRETGVWIPPLRRGPKATRSTFLHLALMQQAGTQTLRWYWSLLSVPDGVAQSIAVDTTTWPSTMIDPGALVCIPEDDGCTALWIQSDTRRKIARLQTLMPCQLPLVDMGVHSPGVLLYEAFTRVKTDATKQEDDAQLSCVDGPANRMLTLLELHERDLLLDAAEQCIVWAFHTLALDEERQFTLLEAARCALATACWQAWRWQQPSHGDETDALACDATEQQLSDSTSRDRLAHLLHWWHQVAMWLRFRNLLAPLTPISAYQLQQPGTLRIVVGRLARYAAVIALQRDEESTQTATLGLPVTWRPGAVLALAEQGCMLSKMVSRNEVATAFGIALLEYAAAHDQLDYQQRAEQWIRALFLPASLAEKKRSAEQHKLSERLAPFVHYGVLSVTALGTGQDRLAYDLALTESDPSARIRALCRLPEASAPAQALQVFLSFYPRISNEDLLVILDRYLTAKLSLSGLAVAVGAYPLVQNALLSELDQRGNTTMHALLRQALGRFGTEKTGPLPRTHPRIQRGSQAPSDSSWFSKFAHLLDWSDLKNREQESEAGLDLLMARTRAELVRTLQSKGSTITIERCLSEDWIRLPAKLLLAALYLDLLLSFGPSQKPSRSEQVTKCLALDTHWVQRVALVLVAQCALDCVYRLKDEAANLDAHSLWMEHLKALASLATGTHGNRASVSVATKPTSTFRSARSVLHGNQGESVEAPFAEERRTVMPFPFTVTPPFSDWDRQIILDALLTILSFQEPGAEREQLQRRARDVLLRVEDEDLRQSYEERWHRLSTNNVIQSRSPGALSPGLRG